MEKKTTMSFNEDDIKHLLNALEWSYSGWDEDDVVGYHELISLEKRFKKAKERLSKKG